MFRCSLAQKSVEQSKLTKSRQIDRTFTKISTQNILACSILTNFFSYYISFQEYIINCDQKKRLCNLIVSNESLHEHIKELRLITQIVKNR